MAKQKRLKCPQCVRKFSMAAHLGRHMSAVHGSGTPKAAKPRKGRKAGRKPGFAKKTATASSDLGGLTLTELCQVIDMARAEAKRRLETM